jgi:ferredoxin/flavodoxin---NADP+ reductase
MSNGLKSKYSHMSKSGSDNYKTVVTGFRKITPNVSVLTFKKKWSFLAGQVVGVAIGIGDNPRMYSLSSSIDAEDGEIIFDVRPEGTLTPRLNNLRVGDKLLVSEPFGEFLGNIKPAWWIATGTGIAPFASMLRSGFGENKKLIHGGSFTNSFYFEDEFKTALGNDYIRCCSRETGEGLFPGRVNKWLEEQKDLPIDIMYYLCGKAEMVVDVRDLLIKRHVPYENIQSEIFF